MKPYPTPAPEAETPTSAAPVTPADLELLRLQLRLSVSGLADYLGTAPGTLRKWLNGTRTPPAAVARLVAVLGLVAALAPDLHAHLVPERRRPGRRPGRPSERAAAPAPAPEGAPE